MNLCVGINFTVFYFITAFLPCFERRQSHRNNTNIQKKRKKNSCACDFGGSVCFDCFTNPRIACIQRIRRHTNNNSFLCYLFSIILYIALRHYKLYSAYLRPLHLYFSFSRFFFLQSVRLFALHLSTLRDDDDIALFCARMREIFFCFFPLH